MNALKYIAEKYNVPVSSDISSRHLPIEIPGDRDHDLPHMFWDLGFKVGAEIGVERAVYSEQLCEEIPGLRLYGIDPLKAYSGYREHVTQKKLDGFYDEILERMESYDFRLYRNYSVPASEYFEDGSLDFVYIDGNHSFLHVTQDLWYWTPKVKSGGIVAGHDFRRNSGKYVNDTKDVIPGFMYASGIKPWFVLTEPEKRSAPSWFFVKP